MEGKKRIGNHKEFIKLKWEKAGAIFYSVDDFEEFYKRLTSPICKCALCGKTISGIHKKFDIFNKTFICKRRGCGK